MKQVFVLVLGECIQGSCGMWMALFLDIHVHTYGCLVGATSKSKPCVICRTLSWCVRVALGHDRPRTFSSDSGVGVWLLYYTRFLTQEKRATIAVFTSGTCGAVSRRLA